MGKPQIEPEQIKKVVVRGTNWVGDAVMTVPALYELRSLLLDSHITLLTPARVQDIFINSRLANEIRVIDKDSESVLQQGRALRGEKFDLAVLFTNSFSSAAAMRLAGAKYRIGYKNEGRGFLLTHPLEIPAWRNERHEIYYYWNIIAELETLLYGDTGLWGNSPRYILHASPEQEYFVRSSLSIGSRKHIVLCPGSTNSRAKRWHAESYAILADRLIGELEAEVSLIGAPDELDVSQKVANLMKYEPKILTGKTSLSEVMAILKVCDLLVSNDTGPAHISASMGTPTIVIFGPTNPLTTRPFSSEAEVLRHEVECSPCMLRDCPIDHRCMTRITVDEVFKKAAAALKRKRKVYF